MLKSLRVIAPIVGVIGVPIALSASALADADEAMFLGGTFEPTPSTAFVEAATSLYLDPLGFAGSGAICDMVATLPCDAALQVLTTPELLEEGPSTLEGEAIFISAVQNQLATGDFDGEHPLTVFAYSQSAMVISAAEDTLYNKLGIPSDQLHFVFIGDPSTEEGIAPHIYDDLVQLFGGDAKAATFTTEVLTFVKEDQFLPGGPLAGYTPNEFYPTTIYTIDTDGVADWQEVWDNTLAATNDNSLAALFNCLYHFITTHVEYMGLTPTEIASGVATMDGLTTTITIPDGIDPGAIVNDTAALINAFGHGIADSGLFNSLVESIIDLFNPAYA